MQRTVISTRFTYVENELHEDGNITATLKTITVPERDEKRAYKLAVKKIGNFAVLKTEKVEDLYVLDDEIFFKYATIAPKNTAEENEGV